MVENTNFLSRIFLVCVVAAAMLSVLGGVGSAVGVFPTLDSGIKLYYHFNNESTVGENYGLSDNNVYDYSGHYNGTTKNNLTYVSNGGFLRDGAFNFNGTNQYITLGDVDINYSAPFTVMVWAKSNKVATTQTIFSKYYRTFTLSFDSSNNVHFNVFHSNVFSNSTDAFFPTNTTTWNHYVGIWNGTANEIYINGILRNVTSATVNNTVFDFTDPVVIGAQDSSNWFFNGSIDDVILLNRSLNSTEVKNYYYSYVGNCSTEIISNCQFHSGVNVLNRSSYDVSTFFGEDGLKIIENNTWVDCNGSTINGLGNLKGSGFFLDENAHDNITISNCNINNFYDGIDRYYPPNRRRNNINYSNNNISNIAYIGINADGLNSGIVYNNRLWNIQYDGLRIHSNDNSIIQNNNISLTQTGLYGIFNDGRSNIFKNNYIYINNNDTSVALEIEDDGVNNMTNNSYINNTINGVGKGYGLNVGGLCSTCFSNYFYNNTFYDIYYGMTGFTNNSKVQGNNITEL